MFILIFLFKRKEAKLIANNYFLKKKKKGIYSTFAQISNYTIPHSQVKIIAEYIPIHC